MKEGNYKFDVRETSLDIKSVESEIQDAIKYRQEAGVYDHYDMTRVTHYHLKDIRDESEFLKLHLKAVRSSWAVDINDFEIIRKKTGIAGMAEFFIKQTVWKLLKFYTYRLFSQQREYNFLISNSAAIMEKVYNKKISALEARINELKT